MSMQMSMSDEQKIIKAAIEITRAESPYSERPWICDVRATVGELLPAARFDELLVEMAGLGLVELRRADMVDGVVDKVEASELAGEWHYAGLVG